MLGSINKYIRYLQMPAFQILAKVQSHVWCFLECKSCNKVFVSRPVEKKSGYTAGFLFRMIHVYTSTIMAISAMGHTWKQFTSVITETKKPEILHFHRSPDWQKRGSCHVRKQALTHDLCRVLIVLSIKAWYINCRSNKCHKNQTPLFCHQISMPFDSSSEHLCSRLPIHIPPNLCMCVL